MALWTASRDRRDARSGRTRTRCEVSGRRSGVASQAGWSMARRRQRVGRTEDWEQLKLLVKWPEQESYEEIFETSHMVPS
jgi:ribosomal protein S14